MKGEVESNGGDDDDLENPFIMLPLPAARLNGLYIVKYLNIN